MRFEQEKMIVGSLPSLYPLQKFEEEAINALVSLPIDDDTISRAKAIEALTEYGNGQTLYISVEEATRRIKQLSPAHGTNLAEVGTDCISREQAIEALDKRFDSIPMEQTSEILMLRKDLRELPPAQPPMPSNTSNALEALDSVNATQSNALDCISRKAAIEAVEFGITYAKAINKETGEVTVLFEESNAELQEAADRIKQLPPAQPEPRWIQVTERLPEEHEWLGTKLFGTTISDEVYVTFENPKGERFCKELSLQNGKLSASDQSTIDAFYKGSKPIAWMPKELPEPYKGVTE